jgi:predicted RNase H-like HicB family nuclease
MDETRETEPVFEPQDEGGYHVYAPDLPGLHTPKARTVDDAMENANEAVALYVEGLREDGEPLDSGVVRRTIPAAGVTRARWLSPASALTRAG